MNKTNAPKIAFFGTPQFAVTILEELKKVGLVPSLVVTAPDKPKGRGLTLTPPPVKMWALENKIQYIQPLGLKTATEIDLLLNQLWDLFIVAAYGKIIPENILEIPKHKTLNVHPSLLPKYRGPSPIEAAILADDREIGVSIMRLDKEMDHGPIVAQEKMNLFSAAPERATDANSNNKEAALSNSHENWPISSSALEDMTAHFGGALLGRIIPDWISGKITEKDQDHTQATYCEKIIKEDGLIDLNADPYSNYLKICAYAGWPGTFFFQERKTSSDNTNNLAKIRVNIKKASYKNNQLIIESVVPEGKPEMPYLDFLRGIK
jgi:methionyl-tRNA formyltransferase